MNSMADNNGKAANPVVFFDVSLGGKHINGNDTFDVSKRPSFWSKSHGPFVAVSMNLKCLG